MNTSSEQDALLAAIAANADDDTLRLAYADWLDEHGEPEQATFIRVQIECHNETDPKAKKKLERRETEAFRVLKKKWADLFAAPVLFSQKSFTRGFVHGAGWLWTELSVEQFVARSGDWWPRLPIREVWLKCKGAIPKGFFNCKHLKRLTVLEVANLRHSSVGRHQMEILPEDFIVSLFSRDPFGPIDRLSIGRVPLSRPVVDAILSAPFLPRLNALTVGYFMSRSEGKIHQNSLSVSNYYPSFKAQSIPKVFARKLNALEDFFVTVPPGETSCEEIVEHTWQ